MPTANPSATKDTHRSHWSLSEKKKFEYTSLKTRSGKEGPMLKLLAMTLLLTTASASAAIFGRIVGAVEEGWVCTPVGSAPCTTGNNGASPTNSYVAGSVQALNSQFRDWFERSEEHTSELQ